VHAGSGCRKRGALVGKSKAECPPCSIVKYSLSLSAFPLFPLQDLIGTSLSTAIVLGPSFASAQRTGKTTGL
jgi:hypothetical protein